MARTIPYEEKMATTNGAFINPNGTIYYTNGKHETFAESYCNGTEEDKEDIIERLPDEIKIFDTTKLTKKQLEIYKLWLLTYGHEHSNPYSDFLVYLLDFDKVETGSKKTITTVQKEPHVRFFNYYLMDWYIEQDLPMRLNKEKNKFEFYNQGEFYETLLEDREAKEEIEDIKKQIEKEDRPLFFR